MIKRIEKGIMKLKDRAKQLKDDIPAVFISLKSKETPLIAKLFAGITIVYALSPIDLIPDFIPIFGYLDDIIILPLLVTLTLSFIPKDTLKKYRQEAKGIWQNGKPKRWYYAAPIVMIWLILIGIFIKVILL